MVLDGDDWLPGVCMYVCMSRSRSRTIYFSNMLLRKMDNQSQCMYVCTCVKVYVHNHSAGRRRLAA
jgi:hypothetical protein